MRPSACGCQETSLPFYKVAEILNVSRQAVSRWETGDASPSIDNLKCLSILYKVSIDYLVNDNEEDFREDHNVQVKSDCEEKKGLASNPRLMFKLGLFFVFLMVLIVIGNIFNIPIQMFIICEWLLIFACIAWAIRAIKRRGRKADCQ
ncbi:MAG: helix-turn-helix transcriptional regulator [Lachnospiraceae bacterium]|nr:helix-turn-helix transcriptional regulator [Lachnospiraceae bacterium]MCI9477752.1 helix-turn-helix transcriptional regulator [Lachnospiraceae bacterium]